MADDIWLKSNFATFRNTSLRITLREPSYVQGEAILRWGWLLSTILLVFSWVKLPCVENEESGMGWYFRVICQFPGVLTLTRHRTGEARRDGAVTGGVVMDFRVSRQGSHRPANHGSVITILLPASASVTPAIDSFYSYEVVLPSTLEIGYSKRLFLVRGLL